MNKKLLIPGIVLVILVIGAVAVLLLKPDAKANPIPDGVYFSQAKKLSQGKRPQCLADNKAANLAVDAVKTGYIGDSFGIVISSRIIDVPAGLTTTTVHSFNGIIATGTNSYTDKNQQKFVGDLQSFNYVAQLNPKTNNWKLTSFIACQ